MTIDLRGRTILLTRSEEDARDWRVELEARGGRAVVLPCLAAEAVDDPATRQGLRAALAQAAYFVLTSKNGVHAAAGLLEGVPVTAPIAAVGPATAAAAGAVFGHVDLVAPDGNAASLGRALLATGTWGSAAARPGDPPRPVVVAAADRAGHDLEDVLVPHGIPVVRIAVYRTVPAAARPAKVDLAALGIDAVFLASPSAVEGLLNQATVPPHLPVISIGPTTSAAVRRAGLNLAGEAARPGLDGLLEALP